MPRRQHPKFDSTDALLDGTVAGELDLHRYPAGEAEHALHVFLETWKGRSPGAVLHVITGRGKGSKGAPILRPLVKRVLKSLPPGTIREFALSHDEGGYRIRLY